MFGIVLRHALSPLSPRSMHLLLPRSSAARYCHRRVVHRSTPTRSLQSSAISRSLRTSTRRPRPPPIPPRLVVVGIVPREIIIPILLPRLLPLRSMPGGKYRGGHVWLDAQEVRRIGHEISVRRRSQRGRQGQDTVVLGCRRRRRCPLPPVAAAILAIDHADAAGLRFVGRCASRRPILVACTPRRRNDGDNRDPRLVDPATILLLLFPHRIALLDHRRSQGRDHVRLSTYPLRPPRMLVPDVDSRRIAVVIPFVAQLSRYYVCAVVNLR